MIYLDNAATTKPFLEITNILAECAQHFYNPSALYGGGVEALRRISAARNTVAQALGAEPCEIYFTSCATEANNAVFRLAHKDKSRAIAISEGEHPSVYASAMQQKATGAKVVLLPFTASGTVDISKVNPKDISLASIIHLSNESGAVNDLSAITRQLRQANSNIIIHSDGVQAVGKMKIDVKKLGVDLYSISGHKLHAPKGIGALYIDKRLKLAPILCGGGQENGMRSGTENVGGILSFEYAIKRKCEMIDEKSVFAKREALLSALTPLGVRLNHNGSPYISSLYFPAVRAEVLLRALDDNGVIVGTGSACSSKLSDNRVLSAMGLDKQTIISSLRISIDELTPHSEVLEAAKIIAKTYLALKENR